MLIFTAGRLVIIFTIVMALTSVTMRRKVNKMQTTADAVEQWCSTHDIAFARQFAINSIRPMGTSDPPDVIIFRNDKIHILSFYEGPMYLPDLIAMFLCAHVNKLAEVNTTPISATYIVNGLPRQEAIEYATELGVGFCSTDNVLNRMEFLLL